MSVERPLPRSIERFTGITRQMLEGAPPPREALPALAELLEGRVLVAHSARFDTRVLAQAFERCGLDWPEPAALCTVARARRLAPLVQCRGLAPLADALGIEVRAVHRALPDAITCARVFCALFPRLCANVATVADALELLRPRRPARAANGRRRPPDERPDLSRLPDDPGVYIFRDARGRPLYVGKSVSLRTRARSHFCAPSAPRGDSSGWTERAATVDYRPTNSELGARVLENRLIKAWRPPANRRLKRTDGYVYLRCRLDIPYPVLEVAPEPASGRAVNVGPLRGRALAGELVDQLTSLFRLRHCGRRLKLREHASAYGQMGRCLSPCLGDLDPNAYRRQLDSALDLFRGPDGAERLLGYVEDEMRRAAAERRYERAAALHRRLERLRRVLEHLEGVLRATQAAPRLVLAGHPAKDRHDAFWVVHGRVADWGPLPGPSELADRTADALRALPPRGAPLPPEAVDEVRIVSTWIAANAPPELDLAGGADPEGLQSWVDEQTSRGTPFSALGDGCGPKRRRELCT